ncbi:type II secretion system protein GspD [Desulfovulcanus sp.]
MKKKLVWLILVFFMLASAGCYVPRKDRLKSNLGYEKLHRQLQKEQLELFKARQEQMTMLQSENKTEETLPVEPLVPTFNPLDEVPVSITVQNETLHNILYVIAKNAGLNLVIEPDISLENRITISFENTPSSLVVNKLLEAYDLAWEVKDNILYVKNYEEQVFKLDFLNVDPSVSTSSGGSISQGSSGSGSFSISGDVGGDKDSGIYGDLVKNIEDILKDNAGGSGEAGMYTLDPVAGTLYVKTTPKRMKLIALLVENVKKKVRKQVIIDAQIMEVSLSDSFKFGIDWGIVQRRLIRGGAAVYGIGVTGGTLGVPAVGSAEVGGSPVSLVIGPNPDGPNAGLVSNFNPDTTPDTTISATIEALQSFGGIKVISNPHIRARHAQPALVTSGTTKTYISQINKDTDDSGNISYTPVTAEAFQGVLLGVIPFINDDNTIDLKIYPVLSTVSTGTTTTVGTYEMTLPEITFRNVDTSVRVHDGDTIILGGLIYKESNKSDGQTPGLGSIPGLGWLFKKRNDNEDIKELVIIMKIRVVS